MQKRYEIVAMLNNIEFQKDLNFEKLARLFNPIIDNEQFSVCFEHFA